MKKGKHSKVQRSRRVTRRGTETQRERHTDRQTDRERHRERERERESSITVTVHFKNTYFPSLPLAPAVSVNTEDITRSCGTQRLPVNKFRVNRVTTFAFGIPLLSEL